jgi:hypothetical protein
MNEMSRSKAKPTTGFAGTVHLNRAEAVALDMTLEYVIEALIQHSGESGVVPFAQRFTQRQLRELRNKVQRS